MIASIAVLLSYASDVALATVAYSERGTGRNWDLPIGGHRGAIFFHPLVLMGGFFPWTFLLIPTFRRQFTRNEQFIVWWAIVPFVFFSFSGSKLPGYILPMVPPVALLCARELLLPRSRTYKIAVFIEAGTMAFIGVGFGFFGSMINVDPHVSPTLIAVLGLSSWSLVPGPAVGPGPSHAPLHLPRDL